MSRDVHKIWTILVQAGFVKGSVPESDTIDSPWYVKVLLAFSGWLAALFLLGFIGVGFQFVIDSSTVSFIIGAAMIGGAFAILKIPKNEFFEHVGLAVSLAGQGLLVWGMVNISNAHDETVWLLVAFMQIMLAAFMPNFIHRVFSSFTAVFCLAMALTFMGVPYVFGSVVLFLASWLWLIEFDYPEHMRKIRAIGYGLVMALTVLKGSAHFGGLTLWRYAHNSQESLGQLWMGELLAGAVMLYVVWKLLLRCGQIVLGRFGITAMVGTLALGITSLEVPGLTAGMVVMLLGFSGSNRVLLGLGIVSLLFYISSYYYLLDTTLLVKSQTLVVVGLVLLTVRWLLLLFIPKDTTDREVADV